MAAGQSKGFLGIKPGGRRRFGRVAGDHRRAGGGGSSSSPSWVALEAGRSGCL